MKYTNVILLIHAIAEKLASVYQHHDEQQQTAWWLLQAITEQSEAELIAHEQLELTEEQEKTLDNWIHRHVHEAMPLQYILGSVPFGSLEILVEQPVLIPRPETEEWCLDLIKRFEPFKKKSLNILDLCEPY